MQAGGQAPLLLPCTKYNTLTRALVLVTGYLNASSSAPYDSFLIDCKQTLQAFLRGLWIDSVKGFTRYYQV